MLVVPANVPPESPVEVLFDMPAQVGNNSYPVLCKGTVVRLQSFAEGFGVAVAFKEVQFIGQA